MYTGESMQNLLENYQILITRKRNYYLRFVCVLVFCSHRENPHEERIMDMLPANHVACIYTFIYLVGFSLEVVILGGGTYSDSLTRFFCMLISAFKTHSYH